MILSLCRICTLASHAELLLALGSPGYQVGAKKNIIAHHGDSGERTTCPVSVGEGIEINIMIAKKIQIKTLDMS